jgi:hypothetical protein
MEEGQFGNTRLSHADQKTMTKLLFFSPHSNIWPHAYPEWLLAEATRKKGNDVCVVNCDGLIHDHCIAMNEAGLHNDSTKQQQEKVCQTCRKRSDLFTKRFALPRVLMDDYFSSSDEARVQTELTTIAPQQWHEYEFQGMPIGRYAAYEFLLKYKINSLDIPEELWDFYLGQLANALRTHIAVDRVLEDVNPERTVAYNTLHSCSRVFAKLSESRDIPCIYIERDHGRTKREMVRVLRDDRTVYEAPASSTWKHWSNMPVSRDESRMVLDAVATQFKGTNAFVYTKAHKKIDPKTTRKRLHIGKNQKVAVAVLSSRDEVFAAELVGQYRHKVSDSSLFASQLEWISHLLELAERRPEIKFVIRVHPRLFPNKRESRASDHGEMLRDMLQRVPENVIVDWPSGGHSLYDLLQVCDVVLSGGSSVGGEAALFGMPVVLYEVGDVLQYPRELNYIVKDINEYETTIDRALEAGWCFERASLALRWYAFEFIRLACDVSDSVRGRRRWSPHRIANGLYTRSRLPLPFFVVTFLEFYEITTRAQHLEDGELFVDTVMNLRSSVAESPGRNVGRHATDAEEFEALCSNLAEMAELLGRFGSTPCLSTTITDFLASHA